MNFERFAELHGLIINHLSMDRWIRVPTTDHPHKKNGSYKFAGTVGWVQNFATMEEPVMWKDKNARVDMSVIRQNKKKSDEDRVARQQKASAKAGFIMKSAFKGTHPYLAKKGFAEEKGYIWNDLLVIPMRIDGSLVGCQLIDKDGTKKFLSGQITKGASAVFENKGLDIIEKRLGAKVAEKLKEGMLSGQNALDLLNTLPAVERSKILRVWTDPSSWASKAVARAAAVQNTPTNNLSPENQNALAR
mgnify:CR=1 FL=1